MGWLLKDLTLLRWLCPPAHHHLHCFSPVGGITRCASVSLLLLGGRGRALILHCVEIHRQWGCDSSPAAALLTSAVFACAAEAVVCCPSSETARSCLETSTEPSHLECWRKQLWGSSQKLREGKKKGQGRERPQIGRKHTETSMEMGQKESVWDYRVTGREAAAP